MVVDGLQWPWSTHDATEPMNLLSLYFGRKGRRGLALAILDGAVMPKGKRKAAVMDVDQITEGKEQAKVLRVSFLIPRSEIPRLQWMMERARVPTKVDLLREALNRLEDQLIDEEATRAEKRRLAGAPPLTKRDD